MGQGIGPRDSVLQQELRLQEVPVHLRPVMQRSRVHETFDSANSKHAVPSAAIVRLYTTIILEKQASPSASWRRPSLHVSCPGR